MKPQLIRHPKPPRHWLQTPRRSNPLVVWLDRVTELRIPAGTKLGTLVGVVRKRFPDLSTRAARELLAYWFTIGERHAGGKHRTGWMISDARTSPERRYLRDAR